MIFFRDELVVIQKCLEASMDPEVREEADKLKTLLEEDIYHDEYSLMRYEGFGDD
jgi:hypothetical protein